METVNNNKILGVIFLVVAVLLGVVIGKYTTSPAIDPSFAPKIEKLTNKIDSLKNVIGSRNQQIQTLEKADTTKALVQEKLTKDISKLRNSLAAKQAAIDSMTDHELRDKAIKRYEIHN